MSRRDRPVVRGHFTRHAPRHDDQHGPGINAKIGLYLTRIVGTIWCFYVFNGIALVSLPSAWRTGNLTIIINWVSSNWIQLVLLPALLVGQRIQGRATDAQTAHMAAGIDTVLDRLDTDTEGGVKVILDRLDQPR